MFSLCNLTPTYIGASDRNTRMEWILRRTLYKIPKSSSLIKLYERVKVSVHDTQNHILQLLFIICEKRYSTNPHHLNSILPLTDVGNVVIP